jgi:hypothetical protein
MASWNVNGLFELDRFLAVAAGKVRGARTEHKFGHNAAVGATDEPLWPEDAALPYLTAAATMKLSCANVNDTALGSGTQSVKFSGVDGNYNLVSETLPTAGQTEVGGSQPFLRVFRVEQMSNGTKDGLNAGIIYVGTGTVVTGKPAVVHGLISAGDGQSFMGFYTVPAGEDAYIIHMDVESSIAKEIEVKLYTREFGGVFKSKDIFSFRADNVDQKYWMPLVFPEKTDLELRGKADGGGGNISGAIHMLLINNDPSTWHQ